MSGHTPGPWDANISKGCFSITVGQPKSDYEIIAMVTNYECSRPDAERDANARLIAAAPELLAACEQLTELDVMVVGPDAEEWFEQVRAAIKKAKNQ